MSIEADIFFAAIATLTIAGIFTLWLIDERRAARTYDRQARRHAFHCIKCGTNYANTDVAETSAPCPHCSFKNARLSF
jgi:DNA-directed RNA polymerase subunit RPC12/RpoP